MTVMDQPVKTKSPLQTESDTASPLDKFYFWEEQQPNKVYLSQPFGDGNIVNYRWSRVSNEVRRIACYLRALQMPPGSRVAILSKNCAHWMMADLAIWLAGHVSVPIYPNLAAETVNQILTHSEARVLFVGKLDAWESMSAGVPDAVHCIAFPLSPPTAYTRWEDIVATTPAFMGKPRVDLDDLATIIYTSGTTGMPKGVMHSFRSIAAAANKASKVYDISSQDRVLSYLPLAHVAERMLVEIASIYNAFTVYFAESLDTFAQDLQRARPTIFFSVPRLWSKFYQKVNEKMPAKRLDLLLKIPFVSGYIKRKIRKTLGLDKARFLVSGAAPLSPALIEWYKKLGMEILEVYGMTENMGYSHATRVGDVRIGYVGKANPDVQVRISE
ncbi:MAG TPA: AMP-binding protein, partial [Pseudomonadales bacterium]|nr:AMP-binding protein [Pseudomonadales bacterium]